MGHLERNPKHARTWHWKMFERLCLETFSLREFATRDLFDKSIIGYTNSGGGRFDRITVGIAEIN